MKYRAEIDGLRALAVVPVILFHAGFELFSGGFVGVDVFFVISGYLITTILIEDIENKRFSIINFYERRARRILPALFFMLFIVFIVAVLLLPKQSLLSLLESIFSTNLFFSNFYFWQQSGYFEKNSLTTPLLHMWSLGVEEQYYLLFPVFLISAWRFGQNKLLLMLATIGIMSLLLSEYTWRSGAVSSNFYLPHTRFWELVAGSISAVLSRLYCLKKNELLAALGVIAILLSIFLYDKTTPFPSVYTLLPVVGVVLLILFAKKETLVAKLLSYKPFVSIGLVSFSAYLWHQPVFAFTRIFVMDDELDLTLVLVALIATLMLSIFSWKYIEMPFRQNGFLTSRKNSSNSFLVVIFLVTGSVSLIGQHYVPVMPWNDIANEEIGIYSSERFGPKKGAFEIIGLAKSSKFNNAVVVKASVSNDCKFLILGDSHAGHLSHGFSQQIAEHTGCDVHIHTSTGCPPLFGFYKVYDIKQKTESRRQLACKEQVRLWEEFVLTNGQQYRAIIFSSRWNWLVNRSLYADRKIRQDALLPQKEKAENSKILTEDQRKDNFQRALQNTAEIVIKAGSKVLFLSQPPVQLLDLRDYASVRAYNKALPPKALAESRNSFTHQTFLDIMISNHGLVFYLDTFYGLFCPNDSNSCINRIGHRSLYFDDDHLSEFGSEAVGELLLNQLQHF